MARATALAGFPVYLVRISLPSLVACRRYTDPLWRMATAFCPCKSVLLSTAAVAQTASAVCGLDVAGAGADATWPEAAKHRGEALVKVACMWSSSALRFVVLMITIRNYESSDFLLMIN